MNELSLLNSGKPKPVFSLKQAAVLRIGVYLVDVLDEAHGDTFIADAYSGSGSKQPGFIDVKTGIIGINDMFLLLQLIMHVTSGPIVLPGFTPGGFSFCRFRLSSSDRAGRGACCRSDVLDTSLASPLAMRCCLPRDSPFEGVPP